MTCAELKTSITNRFMEVPSFLVLVYPGAEDTFLANQYVQAIAKKDELSIRYIQSLGEATYNSFDLHNDVLFVLKTDEFVFPARFDAEDYNKVIILCNKVQGNYDYTVKLPKFTEDNIKEFIEIEGKGLSPEARELIYKESEGNIYRIDNELKKLKEYSENNREYVFNVLKNGKNYNMAQGITIFTAINGILYKKLKNVEEFFVHYNELNPKDVTPMSIVTILRNNIRDILLVQTCKNPTAQDLGLTADKFQKIKQRTGYFATPRLVKAFQFLTGIDYRLKSGLLDMPNDQLVSYIIINTVRELYGN